MDVAVGAKLREKTSARWLQTLPDRLYPGEQVTALSRTSIRRPMCDGLVVTTARIAAFFSPELASKGFAREVLADQIAELEVRKGKLSPNLLRVSTRDGEQLSFGDIPSQDVGLVLGAARQLAAAGLSSDVRDAVRDRQRAASAADDAWRGVTVIGSAPSDKAWKAIRDHSMPGEVAWFVIGNGAAGVFAAFADRCMMVKVGGMAGFMSGSLGGGRITTFPYAEVTGIEYNSGLASGVLEILTPSYSGSANKDYWRGTDKSRNADANDPWTLSNTLPLPKAVYQAGLPRLNEMRARIAEAKRPTIVLGQPDTAPAPPAGDAQTPQRPITPGRPDSPGDTPQGSPADPSSGDALFAELDRAADLHRRGVLDDDEFQAIKQAAISRYSGSGPSSAR
jgi:hypothetical protein